MDSLSLNWLAGKIGKKLVTVLALIYTYDEEKDFNNPQELDLQFLFDGHGKLRCGMDGSSIEWLDTRLEECDLGDSAKQTIHKVSEEPIWKNVMNKTLERVHLVNSSVENCTIGIRFSFEGGVSVSVVNLGDELYVFEEIPVAIVEEQGVTFSDIA